MSDIKGTLTSNLRQLNHKLYVLEINWMADVAGEVNDLIIPDRLDGKLLCIDTVPDALVPGDNLHDPVLLDPQGIDVMGGALADRSNTLPQRVWPIDHVPCSVPSSVHECLTLAVVNNATKNAKGKLKIYFDRDLGEA